MFVCPCPLPLVVQGRYNRSEDGRPVVQVKSGPSGPALCQHWTRSASGNGAAVHVAEEVQVCEHPDCDRAATHATARYLPTTAVRNTDGTTTPAPVLAGKSVISGAATNTDAFCTRFHCCGRSVVNPPSMPPRADRQANAPSPGQGKAQRQRLETIGRYNDGGVEMATFPHRMVTDNCCALSTVSSPSALGLSVF